MTLKTKVSKKYKALSTNDIFLPFKKWSLILIFSILLF